MRTVLHTLCVLVLVLLSALPVAAQITAPNVFTGGTTILSADVNANFAKFADALNRTGGTMTGNLVFSPDNSLDLGASGATRPRTIYAGTSVVAPTFTGTTLNGTTLNLTGNIATAQEGWFSGTVHAPLFVGPISGNVTGNLTGNVTGDVSGNAGTVTNGVYTSGSYANPTWISSLAASKLTGALPAISGASLTSLTAANISAGTAPIDISGNAATVTNGVYTSRTINSKALSSNITLTQTDIGRLAVTFASTTTPSANVATNTWTDSGLTANITMTSASNRVAVTLAIDYVGVYTSSGQTCQARLVRNSTALATIGQTVSQSGVTPFAYTYLDTPGTGTHTYKVQIMDVTNDGGGYCKAQTIGTSTILLQEILP